MAFEKILKGIAVMSGVAGVVMVAEDGEVVASVAGPAGPADLEMDLVGAHYALALDRIKEAGSRVNPEAEVRHIVASTAGFKQLITVIKDGYSLVVIMKRQALSGRVLFESGRIVKEIEEEMG